ncbi:MAG: DNA repair protein RecN [Eubacterium sp.]|nr:DNA repair protein RecN [Eubacterium sp.]
MLINLHVKNLALIEEVDVDFANGLIVLTGETGAGKSLILGSVNIALGNKVSKDVIRTGADFCIVELTFLVNDEIIKKIKNMDIFVGEDNTVTVTRKITESRSVSKINGETVNINTLKQIMGMLIDIHGQHDHQSLLYPGKHLEILDKYAKEDIREDKEELKELYKSYSELKKRLDNYDMDESKRAREIEFAQYEVDEINLADLKNEEDIRLEETFKKLSNSQEISFGLAEVYGYLNYESDFGAGNLIGRAVLAMNTIKGIDENIVEFQNMLYDIDTICRDLTKQMEEYNNSLEFDSSYAKEVEDRLDTINHLKLKYGRTIEDVLEYRDNKQIYLEQLNNYQDEIEKINKKINEYENKMRVVSEQLTAKRRKAAVELEKHVTEALVDLNFISVEFKIKIKQKEHLTDEGIDHVEFMISTNPGEPLKPLAKVASGGELSRIMLAIKSILATEDEIETLIFDEIDTGISGRTASMVAEKLARISKNHQVLCISHLAQIAAMADNHYLIQKKSENDVTTTNIYKLGRNESIEELVRINGDGTITSAAISHAMEMKDMADRTKSNLV